MATILSHLNQLFIFFTGRFLGKFEVKWSLKYHEALHMLPHTILQKIYVRKQVINDKQQGRAYSVPPIWLLIAELRVVYCYVCQ